MRRTGLIVIITAALLATGAAAAPSKGSAEADNYAVLKSIKSPQELLFPMFPRRYCVPVTLSGAIADEMKAALDSLKLDSPRYNETFNGKTFHLFLANENYTGKTREMLSGIMNPVELIDIVVSSVLRYRDPKKYAEIIKDTRITRDTLTYHGRSCYRMQLTPKGERFGYNYQDLGAFVHESWLTTLTITVDVSTRLVYELSTIRYSRTYDASAERPSPDIVNAKYVFNYEQQDETLLPKILFVYFNNAEVLRIAAAYRKENKVFVFDKKEICSSLDGVATCLNVSYGDYQFKGCDTLAIASKNTDRNYSKNLEKAAALAEQANEKMRTGRISEAVRVLQKLADQYGDMPQAVEAKRLLDQLPRGLH